MREREREWMCAVSMEVRQKRGGISIKEAKGEIRRRGGKREDRSEEEEEESGVVLCERVYVNTGG